MSLVHFRKTQWMSLNILIKSRIFVFDQYAVFKVRSKLLFFIEAKSENKSSGIHLLFHTVSSIVPSAALVLTIVFGMGTGVSPGRIGTRNLELSIDNSTVKQLLLVLLERR